MRERWREVGRESRGLLSLSEDERYHVPPRRDGLASELTLVPLSSSPSRDSEINRHEYQRTQKGSVVPAAFRGCGHHQRGVDEAFAGVMRGYEEAKHASVGQRIFLQPSKMAVTPILICPGE